jgi:hypothetical protein
MRSLLRSKYPVSVRRISRGSGLRVGQGAELFHDNLHFSGVQFLINFLAQLLRCLSSEENNVPSTSQRMLGDLNGRGEACDGAYVRFAITVGFPRVSEDNGSGTPGYFTKCKNSRSARSIDILPATSAVLVAAQGKPAWYPLASGLTLVGIAQPMCGGDEYQQASVGLFFRGSFALVKRTKSQIFVINPRDSHVAAL